jgi:hypothetical protein
MQFHILFSFSVIFFTTFICSFIRFRILFYFSVVLLIPFVCSFMFSFLSLSYSSHLSCMQFHTVSYYLFFSVILLKPFICCFKFLFLLSLSYSSYLSYFQTFQPLLSRSCSRIRASELHSYIFLLLETEKHETILT